MLGRVLFGVGGLILGGAAGAYFGSPLRAPQAAHVGPARSVGNEAVVEFRVRVPATAGKPGAEGNRSSTFPQGAMVNTGNPLDLAIEGDGFFQLSLPDGARGFTRGGAFGVSSDGRLVTAAGHQVESALTIPQTAVSVFIGTDGTVSVQNAGAGHVATVLGQLTLAKFLNPGWLKQEGDIYYETEKSGSPNVSTPGLNSTGFIRQGYRERRAEHLAASLADLVHQIAEEEQRGGGVSGVTRIR